MQGCPKQLFCGQRQYLQATKVISWCYQGDSNALPDGEVFNVGKSVTNVLYVRFMYSVEKQ
jgi:hypothetical protein